MSSFLRVVILLLNSENFQKTVVHDGAALKNILVYWEKERHFEIM